MGLILGYIFKINFMMKRRVPRSSRRKGSDFYSFAIML